MSGRLLTNKEMEIRRTLVKLLTKALPSLEGREAWNVKYSINHIQKEIDEQEAMRRSNGTVKLKYKEPNNSCLSRWNYDGDRVRLVYHNGSVLYVTKNDFNRAFGCIIALTKSEAEENFAIKE